MPEVIQSVQRTAMVLDAIAKSSKPLSITQISSDVGLHKSTVHRILYTLIEVGYVKQNPTTSLYELTMKLYELGTSAIKDSGLVPLAKNHLEELRNLSGETVHLVVPDKLDIVYIDKVESNHTLRMHSVIGSRLPMYCTAVGKAILSTKSSDEIDSYWKNIDPIRKTNYTITSLGAFKKELDIIRETSISYDNMENEEGIKCVAVSIVNIYDQVEGAISVSGPIQRMTDDLLEKIIPKLLEVKADLRTKLGRI